jgi:hypothetical protein
MHLLRFGRFCLGELCFKHRIELDYFELRIQGLSRLFVPEEKVSKCRTGRKQSRRGSYRIGGRETDGKPAPPSTYIANDRQLNRSSASKLYPLLSSSHLWQDIHLPSYRSRRSVATFCLSRQLSWSNLRVWDPPGAVRFWSATCDLVGRLSNRRPCRLCADDEPVEASNLDHDRATGPHRTQGDCDYAL